MTLSLCMIVRNEEETLARCLDSVSGCFDKIIILDTGSEDATISVAKKYTPYVFTCVWQDDFSYARNLSFSYADTDYIMWLDADDVLTEENRLKLIKLRESLDGSIDMFFANYAAAYDEDGNPTFYYARERIVKNKTDKKWVGCVHEVIECHGRYEYTDLCVYHKSIKTTYSRRNLHIYERKISADGYLSPRDMFYYARELYYHKEIKKAIHTFNCYLLSGYGWIENRIDAYILLAKCYEYEDDIDAALQALYESFKETLPRSSLACEIGRLLMKQSKYHEAIWWYELALKNNLPQQNGGFINTDYISYIPCLQLCLCYDILGEHKTAKAYNDMVLKERPNSPSARHNMRYFASLEHNDI